MKTAVIDTGRPADYRAREAAERGLRAFGERAAGTLRAALTVPLSDEQRRRIEGLLARPTERPASGDGLRELRAVAVLERIDTADARKRLAELAGGAAGAVLTDEAKAALDRLRVR